MVQEVVQEEDKAEEHIERAPTTPASPSRSLIHTVGVKRASWAPGGILDFHCDRAERACGPVVWIAELVDPPLCAVTLHLFPRFVSAAPRHPRPFAPPLRGPVATSS